MKITKHDNALATMTIEAENKERMEMMLMSDVHFDSTICNLPLWEEHLRIAEERQSPVLIAGDLLDAMQGKWDPRREPENLKEQYKVSAYFDALVADIVGFLSQYDIPAFILGMGNHESSVLRHNGTDLLSNVAYRLRVEHQKPAINAGYWGYLKIQFEYKNGGASGNKILYWHHGISTNAKVTKGTIQINRQSVYLYAPDIVLNGHSHDAYAIPQQVERLNRRTMRLYTEPVWYIRTAGYKKSASEAKAVVGYGAERHRAPKPNGCAILGLNYSHSKNDEVTLDVQQVVV